MAFAREQRLEFKDVQLPLFLQDIVGMWQPVAAARAIDVSFDTTGIEMIRADEGQLNRVFNNLLKNSIEAIDHGPGRVDVSIASLNDELVRVSVADTGPGFPDTIKGFRLFETTKANGAGLGLAVAKQIVLAHGGGISSDRLLPHGTVFRVDLPRHGPVAQ